MRRLGRELGVEGMAIYGYFASKEELLGAVADQVLSELELLTRPDASWQERVRQVIESWAALRDRHPGGFHLLYAKRDWARREFAPVEEILGALRSAGLPLADTVLAYHALVWMLDGILLASSYGDAPVNEVWLRGVPLVDPDEYPRFVEAAPQAATVTARQIFEFGTDLLIRGLERMVEPQSRQSGSSSPSK